MKTQLRIIILCMLVITLFTSCNKNPESPFKLTGSIEGLSDGQLILTEPGSPDIDQGIKINIVDGKFTYTGDYPEATEKIIYITKDGNFLPGTGRPTIFLENDKMSFKAHIDSFSDAEIIGGKAQKDHCRFKKLEQSYIDEFNRKHKFEELTEKIYAENASLKEREEWSSLIVKRSFGLEDLSLKFIRENPLSFYSVILAEKLTFGKTPNSPGKGPEAIEKLLAMLNPKFDNSKIVSDFRDKIERLKTTEIGIENIIDANAVILSGDQKFKGKQHKGIIYLSVLKNDNICALTKEGRILIINPSGKTISSFKNESKGSPKSIAVDTDNNIYVLSSLDTIKTFKNRGKTFTRNVYLGVSECNIYNVKGNKKRSFKIPGVDWVSGAKVVDDKLLIGDVLKGQIVIYNVTTGKPEPHSIEGLRCCCGILDFNVKGNTEVLVANIGAFRVQSYDLGGNKKFAFGQKGRSINDFHACCNPANVAYLSNGSIVTVEKDPVRVKVYGKEGAIQVTGLKELKVNNCTYIPLVVDSKDNLYLASTDLGLFKCIKQ